MSLTETLQALTDPTRREILQLLNAQDMTAGEIAAAFNISKPSISHHLAILKNAELVQVVRKGQTLVYSRNTSVLQELVQELVKVLKLGKEDENA